MAIASLDTFDRQKTVLLTTYRRNGTPVGTPVHIAFDGTMTPDSTISLGLKRLGIQEPAHSPESSAMDTRSLDRFLREAWAAGRPSPLQDPDGGLSLTSGRVNRP